MRWSSRTAQHQAPPDTHADYPSMADVVDHATRRRRAHARFPGTCGSRWLPQGPGRHLHRHAHRSLRYFDLRLLRDSPVAAVLPAGRPYRGTAGHVRDLRARLLSTAAWRGHLRPRWRPARTTHRPRL